MVLWPSRNVLLWCRLPALSIQTLRYDIDVVLFNALATRAGDEVIEE